MLTETGRVVALEGDSVWVETLRSSACGRCSARSGCGHDLMNRLAAGGSRGIVRARRAADFVLPLSVHDSVTIALPERSFLRAAITLYLLPLLFTVGAALGTDALFADEVGTQGAADLAVVLGAAVGLASGLFISARLGRAPASGEIFEPQITAKQ